MDTPNNPTNTKEKGKQLLVLAVLSHWSQGPPFFQQSAELWPLKPEHVTSVTSLELKGITFCCFNTVKLNIIIPVESQFRMWKEFIEAICQAGQGIQEGAVNLGYGQPISQ